MNMFFPEGNLVENYDCCKKFTLSFLKECAAKGKFLEARVNMCDSEHNLWLDLGDIPAYIPRIEGATGIENGSVRDIALISRVNKPVIFKIIDFKTDEKGNTVAVLSRKAVQECCQKEYIDHLKAGDVIDGKVTHLEAFGAFVDIGCGITSLLPIDAISISRIPHPKERFKTGDNIKVVVRGIDENGRVSLTHKELLGTWEENANEFSVGQTVSGIVRSVESYGIFIELAPNLAGLAELRADVKPGQLASVYIKNIIPERMKIKLVVIDAFDATPSHHNIKYYLENEKISEWMYSPTSADKVISSSFSN